MKRRDFLKNAGAAIVPAALPAALWSSPAIAPSSGRTRLEVREIPPIVAVIYDQRYADCRAFADALARYGAKPFATNQDAAQLWYGPLRAHLAQRPGRVAGLATYADFSVSQICGRELGLFSVFEGDHDARGSRTSITHRLRSRTVACPAPETRLADENWASQLAQSLLPLAPFPAVAADRSIASRVELTSPRSPGHPGYLCSWLLAGS